ncbi:MAG: hypothetical protein K2X43_18205 [Hyphomonadaceae bacterium]|nr:hypothetical protein [Hyphomonadaceae bacterium]
MQHLIITSMIALIALAGPLGTQLRANDAHHPEKTAKAKKSTATKPKQQPKKKPAAKANKSNQSEMRSGSEARKA